MGDNTQKYLALMKYGNRKKEEKTQKIRKYLLTHGNIILFSY